MSVGQTNRRAFIAGLGGAAAWPMVARAQQRSGVTVGVLGGGEPEGLDRCAPQPFPQPTHWASVPGFSAAILSTAVLDGTGVALAGAANPRMANTPIANPAPNSRMSFSSWSSDEKACASPPAI
jgi:hypothetical protein